MAHKRDSTVCDHFQPPPPPPLLGQSLYGTGATSEGGCGDLSIRQFSAGGGGGGMCRDLCIRMQKSTVQRACCTVLPAHFHWA